MEVKYENDVAIVDGYKFRKDKKSGYYLSTKKIGTSRIRLHRYMWQKYYGEIPKGFEIHHKDENKDNNEIENLELLTKDKHLAWHGENAPDGLKAKWIDNLNEARSAAAKWHKSKEGKEWHSEMQKQAWKKREPIKYKCKNCGKEFESLKNHNAKFCSPSCRNTFRVKSGVDDETRECVICNSKFKVNKYRKKKTCSRSCASELKNITEKSPK